MTLVGPTTGEITAATLESCEQTIEAGLATFLDVGNALVAINDGKLYKEAGFKTFDAYCQERWSFQRAHARRLIDSAKVVAALSPIGDIPTPANEAQARALAPLKDQPEKLAEAWEKANGVATTEGVKVTAKVVEQVVAEMTQKAEDRAAIRELNEKYQPEGFDADANRELLRQRGALTRLCRDLVDLGDPSDFVKGQDGAVSHPDYVRPARDALTWLRSFLKAANG